MTSGLKEAEHVYGPIVAGPRQTSKAAAQGQSRQEFPHKFCRKRPTVGRRGDGYRNLVGGRSHNTDERASQRRAKSKTGERAMNGSGIHVAGDIRLRGCCEIAERTHLGRSPFAVPRQAPPVTPLKEPPRSALL